LIKIIEDSKLHIFIVQVDSAVVETTKSNDRVTSIE